MCGWGDPAYTRLCNVFSLAVAAGLCDFCELSGLAELKASLAANASASPPSPLRANWEKHLLMAIKTPIWQSKLCLFNEYTGKIPYFIQIQPNPLWGEPNHRWFKFALSVLVESTFEGVKGLTIGWNRLRWMFITCSVAMGSPPPRIRRSDKLVYLVYSPE